MTTEYLGQMVRRERRKAAMNQTELGMVSGTGRRFISDLENGKESCQIGKAMEVLESLGIQWGLQTRSGKDLSDVSIS